MYAIDRMGGAVAGIEQGYLQEQIARSGYKYQHAIEGGSKIMVGVNKFKTDAVADPDQMRIDESIRKVQSEKLANLRAK